MSLVNLIRVMIFVLGAGFVVLQLRKNPYTVKDRGIAEIALAALAVANIFLIVFLWGNHISFPLNLELMEGTVLQHFQRAAASQPIYPQPTPEYVPLAYNGFYYIFAIPFGWLFGVNLFTLRFVSILGTLGSGILLFVIARQKTGSAWWGLVTAGLFAAAYSVMDAYLDTAHADSWMLFTVLLGTYLIGRDRSRMMNMLGVFVLVLSFWFKQHGALFAIGGVLFLTYREGIRESIVYWLEAAVLGPILYVFGGSGLFGDFYHIFTWKVPRSWTEVNLAAARRYMAFILKSYPFLALSGGFLVFWRGVWDRKKLDVWFFQFAFALLTGVLGTLDPGSSNNIYIPMGTWLILMGVLGLHKLMLEVSWTKRYGVHLIVLFATFAVFFFDPLRVIVSPDAGEAYADLIQVLEELDGPVYAPSLGQLQSGYEFYPAANWVALEDMIRGPNREVRNHPNTRKLLEPAIHPQGKAYILTNFPLDTFPWLEFLGDYYVLETDFGERFEPLRVLPRRWDLLWPRYLYRFATN